MRSCTDPVRLYLQDGHAVRSKPEVAPGLLASFWKYIAQAVRSARFSINASVKRCCAAAQIASYELGKLLPEDQRPLPMDLLRIGDSRSDIVPNGGESSP
jgi:hypothetical protein